MTYRVWYAIDRPGGSGSDRFERRFLAVRSAVEGYETIERLREPQAGDPVVPACAFGLEILCNGTWTEWYDDGGLNVMERFGSAVPEREPVAV